MDIAANIRATIKMSGMVQGVVATRSGFTEQQFSDMLNGRKTIRAEYIPQIADALGCTPNDLFAIYDESANI